MSSPATKPLLWKRGLDLRDAQGYYSYAGRKYPSVTTVLEPHDDFLWVHRHAVKAEITRLCALAADGEAADIWVEGDSGWSRTSVNPLTLLQDGEYISNSGFRLLKSAADRGSTIHDMKEDLAAGAKPTPGEVGMLLEGHIMGNRRCCTVDDCIPYGKQLLTWWERFEPRIIMVEGSVFNDEHEYAGRLDSMCMGDLAGDGDDLWKLDLKTGKSFRRGWMAQACAYDHADLCVCQDPGSEFAIEWQIPRARTAILMVQPDRVIFREIRDTTTPFQEFFLPALKAFKANKAGTGLGLPPKGQTYKESA